MTIVTDTKNVDEKIVAESEDEPMTRLRALVEQLSTSEGKTISWKTLSNLVESQVPPNFENLDECISDGCRIIRDLPARSLLGPKRERSTSAFKFQVPYSMIQRTDIEDHDDEEDCRNTIVTKMTAVINKGSSDRSVANYKKRKSARAQLYLKRDAGAEEADSQNKLIESKNYHSEASEDGRSASSEGCDRWEELDHPGDTCSDYCDHNKGGAAIDDVEVPRRFWYRRKDDRIPLSREAKVKRVRVIKAKCRARRAAKAQNAKEGNKKGEEEENEAAAAAIRAEAEKKAQAAAKKPNRGERRAAALRKENAGNKTKPTLAELRARLGKVQPNPTSKEEKVIADTLPVSEAKTPTMTKSPLPVKPPTCEFTFTSRSMAANRLVMMRAELDNLRKNLQEAKKEFEVLQKQESGGAGAAHTTTTSTGKMSSGGKVNTAKGHERLLHSVDALSASIRTASATLDEEQKMVLARMSEKSALAAKKAMIEQQTLKLQQQQQQQQVVANTTSAKSKANVSSPPTPKAVLSPLIEKQQLSPIGVADDLQRPKVTMTATPSPSSPQQQKSPPPLSRRKKANMSNIHHISNHRPSRQLSDGNGRVVLPQQSQQQHHIDTVLPGLDHPTSTCSLFPEEWICVFCEYRLLYGEYPRMMGAVKSRKKLIGKKKDAQERAHRATTIGAPGPSKSRSQCTCGRAHAKALQIKEDRLGEEGSPQYDHKHHHHHHHHHHEHSHHHHHHDDDDHDRASFKSMGTVSKAKTVDSN